jgi:calcium-dependent protein kinase
MQRQQSGGKSEIATVRSSSPGEREFKDIKSKYSNYDIRKIYKFHKPPLGGGNFGTVRMAHRVENPKIRYAVKSILRANIKKDVKQLEEELEILRQVDHPNIIKFHETYIDHRYVHIVMELAEGGELFDKIIKSERFSERRAANYMSKILGAIKHLHDKMVCHRDLKPENFLLSDKSADSEIKLIDFGLSKRFGILEGTLRNLPKKVDLKTIVGTPYYVAPEVLK